MTDRPIDTITLFCWILDVSDDPFPIIENTRGRTVGHLKEIIVEKSATLSNVNVNQLDLWKVFISINEDIMNEMSKFAHPKKDPLPTTDFLLRSADEDHRASKRARLESSQPLCTPSEKNPAKSYLELQVEESASERAAYERKSGMADAFQPFTCYIQYLAEGKLDGFLDSTRREDKVVPGLDVTISTDPLLLLHNLGKDCEKKAGKLFYNDTVHLFNVTGSGKSRLLLDSLCSHWGLYFSCRNVADVSGSTDFAAATRMVSEGNWNMGNKATSQYGWEKTEDPLYRIFSMLLCARFFVLDKFVDWVPAGTDMATARKRWVLLQAIPAHFEDTDDIFAVLVRSLRNAYTDDMLDYVRDVRLKLYYYIDLFPPTTNNAHEFFVVIDEAQVAANNFRQYHPSKTTGPDLGSLPYEFHWFLEEFFRHFTGIIVSGIGLPMNFVKPVPGANSARNMGRNQIGIVFPDTGLFLGTEPSQEAYIRPYLKLDENNASDQRLLDRILHWFSGRHRLTASLIELLLYTDNVPRHRVLTAFAKRLSGFTITDAIDLEEEEHPISDTLQQRIERSGSLSDVELLFKSPNDEEELVQRLIDIFMRWRIGSQPISIPIDGHTRKMIGLGVGHVTIPSPRFRHETNHPVYICEPLMALSLSTLFEKYSFTQRHAWMESNDRSASSRGYYSLKDVTLLAVMDNFGGKFTALEDVFYFKQSSPLASRKVTLVSLQRCANGELRCCPVSWHTGSSDCLGFGAKSPTTVLEYLRDPNGKPFLFPEGHMVSDLLWFFQDQETGELINALAQVNKWNEFSMATWIEAVNSIVPQFFYDAISDGDRVHYSPALYPDISENVENFFEVTLGKDVYKPVVEAYRTKLCSSNHTPQQPCSPKRTTPRLLSIMAIPDNQINDLFEADSTGTLAALKWDILRNYAGSTLDAMKTASGSVV